MNSPMKKLISFFCCLCLLSSTAVFAQGGDGDSKDKQSIDFNTLPELLFPDEKTLDETGAALDTSQLNPDLLESIRQLGKKDMLMPSKVERKIISTTITSDPTSGEVDIERTVDGQPLKLSGNDPVMDAPKAVAKSNKKTISSKKDTAQKPKVNKQKYTPNVIKEGESVPGLILGPMFPNNSSNSSSTPTTSSPSPRTSISAVEYGISNNSRYDYGAGKVAVPSYNLSDEELNLYNNRPPSNVIKNNKLISSVNRSVGSMNNNRIPVVDHNTYRNRLAALPTIIPMEYNEFVGKFIDLYMIDKRKEVAKMLPRSDLYYPIFSEVLNRYNLPNELKHLPVVLSALYPHASDSKGASGLWLMPYGTGKLYELESNSYIDERRDPKLSTEAAVQQLSKLHDRYRDWYLVIAAYHCGVGAMNKAIRQSGNKQDYWQVAEFLPPETQAYVPLFIAANYVMNHYADHGIQHENPPYKFYATDTMNIMHTTDLREVAIFIDMNIEELQFLNPAVKQYVIPKTAGGFPLSIPSHKVAQLDAYMVNVKKMRESIVIKGLKPDDIRLNFDSPWNYPMSDYDYHPAQYSGNVIRTATIIHTIRPEETLGEIAVEYDCEADDIRRWNGIKGNSIKAGEPLTIHVLSELKNIYANSQAKDKLYQEDGTSVGNIYTIKHVVQAGENLHSIARTYEVDVNLLKNHNNINTYMPNPGTTLEVPFKDHDPKPDPRP